MVRNYIAVAAIWPVLCIAFCCCLYYIHTALCNCAAYWKHSYDWFVWYTWPLILLALTYAKLKLLLQLLLLIFTIIILIAIIIPFHTIGPSNHSSPSQILPCLSLSRIPARCKRTATCSMSSSTRRIFSIQLSSLYLNLSIPQDIFNCCQRNFISEAFCLWLSFASEGIIIH